MPQGLDDKVGDLSQLFSMCAYDTFFMMLSLYLEGHKLSKTTMKLHCKMNERTKFLEYTLNYKLDK